VFALLSPSTRRRLVATSAAAGAAWHLLFAFPGHALTPPAADAPAASAGRPAAELGAAADSNALHTFHIHIPETVV
jgi:hypothetical protein